jgi:type II secretion system protein C
MGSWYMNRLLNSKALKFIFKILICITIAKSISLILFIFLPKSGVEKGLEDKEIINLNTYGSISLFSQLNQNGAVSNVQASQISSLKLLAIYKETSGKNAFAVINDGSSSEILKTGDRYKQYYLDEIKSNGIFLKENNNNLWLSLTESTTVASFAAATPTNNRLITERQFQQNVEDGQTIVLKRDEIDELMANPDAVFKNIGFKEVMKDGKIDGFRVLSINRNSPLAKLGLRTGDIIQSFNGIRLDNYSSVLEIYNNAKSYTKVKLEVIRSNKKKEFEYEIY